MKGRLSGLLTIALLSGLFIMFSSCKRDIDNVQNEIDLIQNYLDRYDIVAEPASVNQGSTSYTITTGGVLQ